jgi:hypothetical protein
VGRGGWERAQIGMYPTRDRVSGWAKLGAVNDEQRRGLVAEFMQKVGDPWMRVDHSPQPGSDLAGDDTERPATSPVALHGIVMALDHLGAVVDAMLSGNPMRHYAHFTTLRTVLLSSARVRWLLEPDSSIERRLRGVRIRYQNLDEQRKALRGQESAEISGPLEQQRVQLIGSMDAEEATLEARTVALGAAQLTFPLDTVSLLKGMVDVNTWEGLAVTQMWRTGSAAAHGYFWTDQQRNDANRFDEMSFNGALYGATLFVSEAMKLYDQRSTTSA